MKNEEWKEIDKREKHKEKVAHVKKMKLTQIKKKRNKAQAAYISKRNDDDGRMEYCHIQ